MAKKALNLAKAKTEEADQNLKLAKEDNDAIDDFMKGFKHR